MKLQEEVLIRTPEIMGVLRLVEGLSVSGCQWLGWTNLESNVHPSMMHGLRTRERAEAFCRTSENHNLQVQAVPLQAFADRYKRALDKYVEGGMAAAMRVSLRGLERADPHKAVNEKRLEHIKQQLTILGIDPGAMAGQLREEILRNENRLRIPIYLMEGHHPLKINIEFSRNKIQDYDLKQLEISGIEVLSGIIGKVDLDDLQLRMSQINWSTRYNDPNEWAKMRPVLEDMARLERYQIGKDVATRLYLKYIDSAYSPTYQASPDPRREKLEKRLVIRWEKDKPIKLKQACELFVGKAAGRVQEDNVVIMIEKKDISGSLKAKHGRSKGR